jgi:hypothetical protein
VVKNPNLTKYDSLLSVQLTAVPSWGYHFTTWNGDLAGSINPDTIIMDANKTISANFAINVYSITANSDTNGSISPSGVTNINHGSSQSYTISPDPGYRILAVLIDGISIGAVTNYNFPIVSANHTISASFIALENIQIILNRGWNLVSVPLVPLNNSASVLFPDKIGSAFAYNTALKSYYEVATLSNGIGYWVFYQALDTITISGTAPGVLTVNVSQQGWVLFGSRNTTVPLSSLVLSNGASIIGDGFRYRGGYESTMAINPGDGVWLFVDKACTITLPQE